MKILIIQASPLGTAPLRLSEEVRVIEESFKNNGLNVDMHVVGAMKRSDLQSLLVTYRPEIVHFSGHGNQVGELYFENNDGKIEPIAADILESVFVRFKSAVNFVVLNACYSEYQADAISKHIPYVIGMTNPIKDRSAIIFSAMLYKALALGCPVEEAFDLAKNEVVIQSGKDEAEPILRCELAKKLKIDIRFGPVIYASFVTKRGVPIEDDDLYWFKVWIKNYSSKVKKVVYQWDEDEIEFEEQFDEQTSSHDDFASEELAVYGDIIIRATLWSTNERGIGITANLATALRNHYKDSSDPAIIRAIEEIEEN